MLKFLPSDKAQDARNFVQGLQYWLGGNSENLQVGVGMFSRAKGGGGTAAFARLAELATQGAKNSSSSGDGRQCSTGGRGTSSVASSSMSAAASATQAVD